MRVLGRFNVAWVLLVMSLTMARSSRKGQVDSFAPDANYNDGKEWNSLSHLRLSSSCARCLWPAHSGSTLFRLFRGRRSPTVPRLAPELLFPFLQLMTQQKMSVPPAFREETIRRKFPGTNPSFVISRGSAKPASRIAPGARLPVLPRRVLVKVSGMDGIVYTVTTALRPQTNVFDALFQAAATFRDKNPSTVVNPFTATFKSRDRQEECVEVSQVGPWLAAPGGKWVITVSNNSGKIVMNQSCFGEADGRLSIYPGFSISLQYQAAILEPRKTIGNHLDSLAATL